MLVRVSPCFYVYHHACTCITMLVRVSPCLYVYHHACACIIMLVTTADANDAHNTLDLTLSRCMWLPAKHTAP